MLLRRVYSRKSVE